MQLPAQHCYDSMNSSFSSSPRGLIVRRLGVMPITTTIATSSLTPWAISSYLVIACSSIRVHWAFCGSHRTQNFSVHVAAPAETELEICWKYPWGCCLKLGITNSRIQRNMRPPEVFITHGCCVWHVYSNWFEVQSSGGQSSNRLGNCY